VLLIGLLVTVGGTSETNESRAWLLAFALALPGGLILAARQERHLAAAAPAAAGRALAGALVLLALAFLFLRTGSGDHLHHLVLALAALGALGAPYFAARRWRDPSDHEGEFVQVACLLALAFLLLLFVPRSALMPGNLIPALALVAAAVLALRLCRPWPLRRSARVGLDLLACLAIALVVVQLPDLPAFRGNLLTHHLYFLGPANDVVHGRAMVSTAWSQYGTGLIDWLGLVFTVVPIGFGTLALLVTALTTAVYLCVYSILRMAGVGLLLSLIAIAVAALGNVFAPLETYVVFPSTSPLRFGIPYLIVLCAVTGTRFPRLAVAGRAGVLALLALASIWSFETFIYTAGTYGALVLVEAMGRTDGALRRVLRGALVGVGACAAAVAAFSLGTLVLSGHLDWGPYIEYLRVYSTADFFNVRIEFFSAGPLMAAVIFASAVLLLWLVRTAPTALPAVTRTALAGFTGFAVVSFTYYLGRSHPNNLLVLLLPVMAIAALWMQPLLTAPRGAWRTATLGGLVLGMAMIAVAAWPAAKEEKGSTAFGLMIPGDRSLGGAASALAHNPVLDRRAPIGTALLHRYWPAGTSALVLLDQDLTTEVLLEADRSNVLPISHPPEDQQIESSEGRVRAAAERVPAGTLILTSSLTDPVLRPSAFTPGELAALEVLRPRFRFVPVRQDPSGLEVVRLVPRG
jgi:hypothetical protein